MELSCKGLGSTGSCRTEDVLLSRGGSQQRAIRRLLPASVPLLGWGGGGGWVWWGLGGQLEAGMGGLRTPTYMA